MRLRLNTTLRAALIAAITAVGFTLTQAEAATTLNDAVLTFADFSTNSITSAQTQGNRTWTFANLADCSQDGVYTVDSTKRVTLSTNDAWATNVGTGSTERTLWSAIVKVDATSLSSIISSGGILIDQTATAQLGLGYTTAGKAAGTWEDSPRTATVSKSLSDCVDNDGNITIAFTYRPGNDGCKIYVMDGSEKLYSAPDGGLRGGPTAGKNPSLQLGKVSGLKYKSLYVFGDQVTDADMENMMKELVSALPVAQYTWNGAQPKATWDTSTPNWEGDATYKNSSTSVVTFGTGDVAKEVTIASAIQAGTVNVQDNYTFNLSNGGGLTTESIVATGDLALDGSGTIKTALLNVATDKKVSIASGVTLETDSRTGNGKISGAGTFQLNQASKGDVTINADNFSGTFIFNEGNVSQHDTSIIADAQFTGTVEIRGRIRTGGTDFGNAQKVRFEGDRSSNNTGVWSNNAATWAKDIEITGSNAVQFELSNTLTLTGALSGAGTLMTTNNSTLNIQGGGTLGTLYAKAGNANGRVNISNKALTLDHLYAGGGTVNIGTTVTTGQVRLSENGINGVVVSVNEGGTLNVTGTENGHNTNASMLLAHWGQTSTLKLNGGTINAKDTEMHLSWTGTGTFEATSGTAYLKGIDGNSQDATRRGSFVLGSADAGTATVVLGSTGLKEFSDNVVLSLGNGTLGASADWSLSPTSGRTETKANLIGTGIGTVIDTTDAVDKTTARTITFNNATTGAGKLTVTGKGKLVLNGGGDRTGDTSVQSEATLEVNNAAALGTTGTVTVAAGAELKVNAALGLAGRLQSSGNITVTENGNLTLAAGSMISNVVSNSGAVNLSGVTLSQDGGFTETGGGTAYFDLAGAVTTAEANHYEGTAGKYVQVVDNGELGTSTGTGLVWKDKSYDLQENGTIIVEDGTPDYGTFYVMTEVSSSQLIDSDNYEKLNTIVVGGWAELNMDEAISGKTIEVLDGGFVTGTQVTPESIAMDAGAVTVFNNDVTTENGVTFSAQVAVSMTNTNQEGGSVQYSTGAEAIAVTADTMTVSNSDTQTIINNSLVLDEIVNNNAEGLLLQGNVADGVTLNAAAGDITMVGQTSNTLSVVDLTIAAGQSVEMLNEGLEEGTITVTGVLTGGDATLLSNLTLKGGSTLNVAGGGGDKALTLGSILTIDLTEGGLVNLDQTTIDALAGLQDGQSLDLIVAANGTQLDYVGAQTGMDYAQLFAPAEGLTGNYTVYAQGDAFGLVRGSQVPEPTTGTLSLLALAALAARRRRK